MATNNHPANGPVSLDRLHQIREILSKAVAQSDGGNLGYAMADAVKVIDGAIAASNADPVAYADPQAFINFKSMGGKNAACTKEWMWRDPCNGLIPLYSAPPAPVVPPKIEPDYEVIKAILPTANPDFYACCVAADMWNACRAVMLQGTDGKPELTVWYGSMPETNGKTNFTAMLHRKGQHPWEGITIDRSEYPDRVRYEADRMRHLIGELPDEPDILSYDADAHSGYVKLGNSPVTPESSTCKYCGGTGYFRWQQSENMCPCPCVGCDVPAAPQQEVS